MLLIDKLYIFVILFLLQNMHILNNYSDIKL